MKLSEQVKLMRPRPIPEKTDIEIHKQAMLIGRIDGQTCDPVGQLMYGLAKIYGQEENYTIKERAFARSQLHILQKHDRGGLILPGTEVICAFWYHEMNRNSTCHFRSTIVGYEDGEIYSLSQIVYTVSTKDLNAIGETGFLETTVTRRDIIEVIPTPEQ